jgi:hypothetical protein
MGAYENPQTVITDTSSAWTNMSKAIANNTVSFLEKQGAIRNAEIKKQQEADVALANKLVDSREKASRELNKVEANKKERELYMSVLDDNFIYSQAIVNAKSTEERKIALQNYDSTQKKLNSILDFAKNRPQFEEYFESNNNLTARGEEGGWSVEGGFQSYKDFIDYGTGWTSGLSATDYGFDENNNLTLTIADPLGINAPKSFNAAEFLTTTPPITPKITEYTKKKLIDKGILNPKDTSKLSDEYNKMPREQLEALVAAEILSPVAEGVLTNPNDTQSIWANVLKGKDRLGYPPVGSKNFPIEGSPFTKESYEAFLNTFQDWGLRNLLPKNHIVPVKTVDEDDDPPEVQAENKFNLYMQNLGTAWTEATGERAFFDPKTNIVTVSEPYEDDEGTRILKPKLYDLSQPGNFVNYIKRLTEEDPKFEGTSEKNRKVVDLLLAKARARANEFAPKPTEAEDYKGFEDYLTGQIKTD